MNNDIMQYSAERRRGIVKDFAHFSAQMLHSMKYDVMLSMSVEQLTALQSFYLRVAHRDPTLDELYLLDRILQTRTPARCPISDFLTDSPLLAETYADLMAKRAALPDCKTAPTLHSLMNVASSYLTTTGKSSSLSSNMTVESSENSEFSLHIGSHKAPLTTHLASLGTASEYTPTPGHLLVLTTKWGDMTDEGMNNALTELLSDSAAEQVRSIAFIDREGLVGALCRIAHGAYIDMTALPIAHPSELEAICDACHGALISVIPSEDVNIFMRAANERMLWSGVIGSLTSDAKLTINHERARTVVYDMEFIKSLSPMTAIQPVVGNLREEHECNIPLPVRAYSPQSALMLTSHTAHHSTSPFIDALYNTLAAIADCVANGASYRDICLSFDIKLPPPVTNAGIEDALEILLGAYRAQIEYCIPDKGSRLVFDDLPALEFIASAASRLPQGLNHTSTLGSEHSGCALYLLRPNVGADGMVDFEQLRRMWDYVTALVRSGDIVSASAVTARGVTKAIDGIISGNMTLIRADSCTEELLSSPAPGGIIAATRVRLDGIFLGNAVLTARETAAEA
ncbi:MAG: hypothetical protein IJY27_02760 [Clostridia bacterium]|nr:hypothetical protein [Clostridia bacterium]